mmetsp:Transcript_5141/g.12375  ORF Transcript_5141/g.12375 Transcript_5141/m.12375 type:complete len:241 (+) Transcript_5141:257-979(+)
MQHQLEDAWVEDACRRRAAEARVHRHAHRHMAVRKQRQVPLDLGPVALPGPLRLCPPRHPRDDAGDVGSAEEVQEVGLVGVDVEDAGEEQQRQPRRLLLVSRRGDARCSLARRRCRGRRRSSRRHKRASGQEDADGDLVDKSVVREDGAVVGVDGDAREGAQTLADRPDGLAAFAALALDGELDQLHHRPQHRLVPPQRRQVRAEVTHRHQCLCPQRLVCFALPSGRQDGLEGLGQAALP